MLSEEIYECIDCNYADTSYHTFSECYFCIQLICNECTIENNTSACNNCNFHSKCIYFDRLEIKCSLCKTKIFIENEIYCNKCNYIICDNCVSCDSNGICVNCYQNDLFSKLTNLKLI